MSEVPTPHIDAGEVLVRVQASCLSTGTELSAVQASATPMWRRALHQPQKVRDALQIAVKEGVHRTWQVIKEKKDATSATGYSAAGLVVEVGSSIVDLVPGDRVACAGGGFANHAEFIRVPRNLCALLTDEVDWDSASTVTLGAIALQAIRRAQPTLGETFVVMGLGILGQLTVQLLRVNGCRTIGVDLDRERIALAQGLGMNLGVRAGKDAEIDQVAGLTEGIGADGVIITAASPSDAVVSSAFNMCRKKGRVVLVGDVGLNLNRTDFYAKEIDFLISTSYGPGRYDRRYEERGLDYPVAYVRWTENRNMVEYLRLLAEKRVEVAPLISARYPVSEATKAYESLAQPDAEKPILVLLAYPTEPADPVQTLKVRPVAPATDERIQIAVVGAGDFSRAIHLPNVQSLSDRLALQAVVTRSGDSAAAAAKRFGATYASTDYESILSDEAVDAVIIATRHDRHAAMTLAALRAGKHVLVEKPLALTPKELEELDAFVTGPGDTPMPVLMTGYNRRFSPYARVMKDLVKTRTAPFMLNYRMNAGYIAGDHWVQGPEGGGRNLGEACHIYDLFAFLSDAEIASVSAHGIRPGSGRYLRNDNFIATVSLTDGSVATLNYSAMGSKDYSKETADLYVDGNLAVLDDYRRLVVHGARATTLQTPRQEKGHREELERFADAINTGDWAIPWSQQLQTARLALTVEDELRSP